MRGGGETSSYKEVNGEVQRERNKTKLNDDIGNDFVF